MKSGGEVIRVAIADDHAIFREGLRMLLDSIDDIEVVGEAATTDDAVRLVDETTPDVIVMDLHMPTEGGIAATQQLARRHPGVGVLVLTMLDDDRSLAEAMRAGAGGYVLKGAGQSEVVAALRSVAAGGSAFGHGIAERVVAAFLDGRRVAAPALPRLSAREREVVDLVARGLRNPAIAQQLHLSPKTVRNLVSSAMAKVNAADRTALALLAREAGLGEAGLGEGGLRKAGLGEGGLRKLTASRQDDRCDESSR